MSAFSSNTSSCCPAKPELDTKIKDAVKNYYGKVLKRSDDLKTNCCTTGGSPSARFRKALANVHPEVLSTYYGCGIVDPQALHGKRVLDLGSGEFHHQYTTRVIDLLLFFPLSMYYRYFSVVGRTLTAALKFSRTKNEEGRRW